MGRIEDEFRKQDLVATFVDLALEEESAKAQFEHGQGQRRGRHATHQEAAHGERRIRRAEGLERAKQKRRASK